MSASFTKNEEGEGNTKKKHVKITPIPKLQMVAVGATLLAEAICTSMLFPFVGLFVAHLRGVSVESAGYASGMLVGLFMLGQVVSGKFWGRISDLYGRKVPLCIGLVTAAFVMLFFGMSPNFTFCCLMRFLHGIFNGNILIAKIIISDITDETNQAVGFSMVGLLWSIGSVIGPAVGGFLYDPLENPKLQFLHVQKGSFLANSPAFLPSLFVFFYTIFSFIVVLIVVPETNKNRTKSLRNVLIVGWFVDRLSPKQVTVVELPEGNSEHENQEGSGAENVVETASFPLTKPRTMSYREAFSDPILRNIFLIGMCASSTDMAYGQVMPLWAIAAREVGGLGLFSDAVGLLILSFAAPTFIVNLSFPTIYRKVGNPYIVWRIGASILLASVILTPFGSELSSRAGFWYVLVMGSIKQGIFSGCFAVINMLTVNAALPGTVGSVYGILQSVLAAVRCVVPFVVSPIFAWSISSYHPFPLNHYFVFFLSGLPMVVTLYLSAVKILIRPKQELLDSVHETQEKENREDNRDDLTDERASIWRCASVDDFSSAIESFAPSSNERHSGSLAHQPRRSKRSSSRRREKSPHTVLEWIYGTTPLCHGEVLTSTMQMLLEEDSRVSEEEILEENRAKELRGVV